MSAEFAQEVRRASTEISRAWSACIESSSLGGRASIVYGADPRTFSILLRVRGPIENRGTAQIAFLSSRGDAAVRCSLSMIDLSRGVEFTSQADIGCARDRIDTPVTITVNYRDGLGSTTLRLPAVVAVPPPRREPITIRAVDFVGGVDVAPAGGPTARYGAVLLNAPPYNSRPNSAEWNVPAPAAGRYRVEVEYAAAGARPVDVIVNGSPWRRGMLNEATGCWDPQCQKWVVLGDVQLRAGDNRVRFVRGDVFPHIRTLRFMPAD
jgi:hypothetical protein